MSNIIPVSSEQLADIEGTEDVAVNFVRDALRRALDRHTPAEYCKDCGEMHWPGYLCGTGEHDRRAELRFGELLAKDGER